MSDPISSASAMTATAVDPPGVWVRDQIPATAVNPITNAFLILLAIGAASLLVLIPLALYRRCHLFLDANDLGVAMGIDIVIGLMAVTWTSTDSICFRGGLGFTVLLSLLSMRWSAKANPRMRWSTIWLLPAKICFGMILLIPAILAAGETAKAVDQARHGEWGDAAGSAAKAVAAGGIFLVLRRFSRRLMAQP